MKVYICSTGNISPQYSLDREAFLLKQVAPSTDYFRSIEPEYHQFVDSKMIRRMSRIVKMGVAAAMTCLRNANTENPAAILTATAFGCLEDTSTFLRRMIEFEETLLSPTAFIQSTHNTVGAQIALLLKCHNYNNTIVHRAFSFENALRESILLLKEGMGPVLVGAVDEFTEDRQAILSRFGLYKKTGNSLANIAGEGAAFFLLDSVPGNQPLAVLRDIRTLYNPENFDQVMEAISEFMNDNEICMDDIGLILTAHSGNAERDNLDEQLIMSVYRNQKTFPFKSICGDYPTASGFACWLGAFLIHEQKQPAWMTELTFPLKNILIHHHDGGKHHGFILIGAC